MSALDELLHDQQAIMLVYSGEILDAALFKAAIRAEIAEQVRAAMDDHLKQRHGFTFTELPINLKP